MIPTAIATSAPKAPEPSGDNPGAVRLPTSALFSPRQITWATFCGGALAGGGLLALNFRRMGHGATAWITALISVLACAGTIGLYYVNPAAVGAVALIQLLAFRGAARSLQGEAYERHLALDGPRGSLRSVVVAILGAYALLTGGVYGYMRYGMSRITVGDGAVQYTHGATRAEAEATGKALSVFGIFAKNVVVEIRHAGERREILFPAIDSAFSDTVMKVQVQLTFNGLSDVVFGGRPLDVWLADDHMVPVEKLAWEHRPVMGTFAAGTVIYPVDDEALGKRAADALEKHGAQFDMVIAFDHVLAVKGGGLDVGAVADELGLELRRF